MADLEEEQDSKGPEKTEQEWYIDIGEGQEQASGTSVIPPSDTNINPESTNESRGGGGGDGLLPDDLRSQLSKEMAGHLWQAGKQSTQRFINTYAHIDLLRPYFDVEPSQFRDRLIYSFIPNVKVGAPQDAPSELYGPTMLVFTLVAILLYGMKTSGHTVEDGTLIGTALVVCMGYWFGLSLLSFFISYLLTAHLSLIQLMAIIGYSLSAHCVILSLSTVFDHYGTPVMFYLFWIIFGLLTTCKQVGILLSRSWSLRDGLILSLVMGSCHLSSILYLRFMYHRVYEALAEAI